MRLHCVLFGGVVQLVLVGPVETFAHAAIGPESLHCGQQLVRERLCVFHARYHVKHQLRIRLHRTHSHRSCDEHGRQLTYSAASWASNVKSKLQ